MFKFCDGSAKFLWSVSVSPQVKQSFANFTALLTSTPPLIIPNKDDKDDDRGDDQDDDYDDNDCHLSMIIANKDDKEDDRGDDQDDGYDD